MSTPSPRRADYTRRTISRGPLRGLRLTAAGELAYVVSGGILAAGWFVTMILAAAAVA